MTFDATLVNSEFLRIERPSDKIEPRRIGPAASFKTALVVTGLPKSRSGKILRGTMRKIADVTGDDRPGSPRRDRWALTKAGYGAGPRQAGEPLTSRRESAR